MFRSIEDFWKSWFHLIILLFGPAWLFEVIDFTDFITVILEMLQTKRDNNRICSI